MRDLQLFDKAVKEFFGPIARRLRMPIARVEEGIYEISSEYFILRIRLSTGHARGLNVILREASMRNFNEGEPYVQYGIGCFIEFHGEPLTNTFIDVNTADDFIKQAELLAAATQRFGVPYLLGEGKDFAAIKEMFRKRAEEQVKEIEGYRFPKNVRKEWL